MKNILVILSMFVSVALFGQTNNPATNQVQIPDSGFQYTIGPYKNVQVVTYDGSASNFCRLDFTYNCGYLLLTNNARIWPDNTPADTGLCGNYDLYVVAITTNVYTLSVITNTIICSTNFYQPQQSQSGWQFGATMYKLHAVGSNVMIEGGEPIYYHR